MQARSASSADSLDQNVFHPNSLQQFSDLLPKLQPYATICLTVITALQQLLNDSLPVASEDVQNSIIGRYKTYVSMDNMELNDFFYTASVGYKKIETLIDADDRKKLDEALSCVVLKMLDERHQLTFLTWLDHRLHNWHRFSLPTFMRNYSTAVVGSLAITGLVGLFSGPVGVAYGLASFAFNVPAQVTHYWSVNSRCEQMLNVFAKHFPAQMEKLKEMKAKQQSFSFFNNKPKTISEAEPLVANVAAHEAPAPVEPAPASSRSTWINVLGMHAQPQQSDGVEMGEAVSDSSIQLRDSSEHLKRE